MRLERRMDVGGRGERSGDKDSFKDSMKKHAPLPPLEEEKYM